MNALHKLLEQSKSLFQLIHGKNATERLVLRLGRVHCDCGAVVAALSTPCRRSPRKKQVQSVPFLCIELVWMAVELEVGYQLKFPCGWATEAGSGWGKGQKGKGSRIRMREASCPA